MKLIVGLGNPGKDYKGTRHNTGFMFLDRLASDNNVNYKLNTSLKCEIADMMVGSEKVYLIKPQTYMNLSGQSVKLVCNYYHIDISDVLVIHDELDLEVGRLRFRSHGSSGGHKGIQNIMDEFKTQEVKRLKVGISKVESKFTVDYVLGNFSKDDQNTLNQLIDKVDSMVRDFCTLSFENLMSRYNN